MPATNPLASWTVDIKADMMPLIQNLKTFEAALERADVHAQHAKKAIYEVGDAGAHAGRGILQAAYAIDDLQYGFRSIVNNIPQIVLGLGGTAGMAGAIGVLTVATSQLINHWDQLVEGLTGEGAKLPVIREGIDGLTHSISKLGEEIEKLQEKSESGPAKFMGMETGGQALSIAEEKRLNELKKMSKETKEQLQIQQDMKALGKNTEEEGTAERFKKAVKALPRGSEDLKEALIHAGYTAKRAEQIISQASRGNDLAVGDVINALPQQGKFSEMRAGFEQVTPAGHEALQQKRLEAKGEHNARVMGEKLKDDEKKALELDDKERVAWLEDINKIKREKRQKAKREAIQDLEDKRDAIQDQLRADLEGIKHGRPSQIIGGGPKASLDLYQMASPKENQANELRRKANTLLTEIRDKLKEEHRARLD